eukprot:15262264-Alexandrium_andersonii.AAC.1
MQCNVEGQIGGTWGVVGATADRGLHVEATSGAGWEWHRHRSADDKRGRLKGPPHERQCAERGGQ